MAKWCCGCGDDLAKRGSDRRSLKTSKAVCVLSVWRNWLQKLGREDQEQKHLQEDGDLLMCRKCFSAFERYYKLEEEIRTKLLRSFKDEVTVQIAGETPTSSASQPAAVSSACATRSSRKRPRGSTPARSPVARTCSTSSPSVSVS